MSRTCPASHGGPHGPLTLRAGTQPRVAVPGPVPLRESKDVLLYVEQFARWRNKMAAAAEEEGSAKSSQVNYPVPERFLPP